MDQPVKDIKTVLKKLTHGTPHQQHDAFATYFLPTASLIHPLVLIPSFPDLRTFLPLPSELVQYIPVVDSRFLIQSLYRLNSIILPVTDLEVESAVYDQRGAVLTLHVAETLNPVFLPFHAPRVKAVVVLHLVQRTLDAEGHLLPENAEGDPAVVGGRTRLFVAGQEDVIQVGDLMKTFIPVIGGAVWIIVQIFITIWCLLFAAVIFPAVGMVPEEVVRNGDHIADEKEHAETQ